MHRGTDFAAPMGTPIMASGDGVIKKAGWCGGGGNCVKIKHNSTYQTVYAHMSKFARGIKPGVRVKQGQTIGYVGIQHIQLFVLVLLLPQVLYREQILTCVHKLFDKLNYV